VSYGRAGWGSIQFVVYFFAPFLFSFIWLASTYLPTYSADKNSVFPAGVNVAATFSRRLMRLRGEALGAEFRGKGVDVMLGPVAGALGRVPQGGRNWEGFR
jgi:hypothetical protein